MGQFMEVFIDKTYYEQYVSVWGSDMFTIQTSEFKYWNKNRLVI